MDPATTHPSRSAEIPRRAGAASGRALGASKQEIVALSLALVGLLLLSVAFWSETAQ